MIEVRFMSRFTPVIFLILVALLAGCGGNRGGASSPEKLFDELRRKDRDRPEQMVDLVVPEERPLLAFSIDFVTAFATSFAKDDTVLEEYRATRERYGLAKVSSTSMKVDLQDPDSLVRYASAHYGSIDIRSFLADMAVLLKKISPGKGEKSGYTGLENLKVEGDTARGTALLGNGKTRPITFRKVEGRWYLSIRDNFTRF
jgi:hypothetical protein